MKILPQGSVVFFDVGNDQLEGTVMRNVDLKHKLVDPLCGRIIYKDGLSGKHVQIPYGDRDQCDPYTLQPGDLVNFVIAVDRRDQLERAHNIRLRVRETFKVSKEKRDKVSLVGLLRKHHCRCVSLNQFIRTAILLRTRYTSYLAKFLHEFSTLVQ